MARMSGFVFQDEYLERLAKLSDQEVGRMVRALAEYHATGKEPELAGREAVAFDFIRVDVDKADRAYKAKCDNMKRGRPQLDAIDCNCDQLTHNKNKNRNKKETVLSDSKEKREHTSAEPTETDRLFDKFWSVYPRHEGKQDARKAFAKLKPDDALLERMIDAIICQKQSAQWQDAQYIPHPATWLNGRRWEDEPTKDAGPAKPRLLRSQDYKQREYNGAELETALGVSDLFREGAS